MSSDTATDCEGTLIISCGSVTPENIICHILGVESLPEAITLNSTVKGYPWSFETKYYSSQIKLYALEEKKELDPTFCDTVKAVIFYFDSDKQASFEDVQSWMTFLKNIDAEVQLLVCGNCLDESDNPVLERKNILKWCVENQYELVELNPPTESDDEDERAFKDAKGYGRIVEALQSYAWANLVLAGGSEETESSAASKENLEASAQSSASKEEAHKRLNVEGEELLMEEKWLNSVLSGEDTSGESIEALFSKFATMKDKAEGLAGEDRKKYAEKVAIAFWRAMGGDEDEIEGLDDSDEE